MIEAIKEIGDMALSENPEKFLESLALDIPSENKGKKQYVVIIEFDTTKEAINFEIEEIREETARTYLWIGNASSPNDPQDRLSTNNLEYLISQTLPNIKRFIPNGESHQLFERIINKFYYDIGPQNGQKERYRYIWDIEKLGISSKSMKQILEEAENDAKKAIGVVTKEIFSYLKREKNLTKDEISLFTLKVNGRLLINLHEYRKYIETSMVSDLFSDGIIGKCHLCQEEKEITQNMTKLKFKYYITDKIGFSSGLQKEGFLKNFSLCNECYQKLLVGESFIKNNLRSYIAGSNLYIIPKFIFDATLPVYKLKKWAGYINVSFNSTTTLEGLKKFQEKIKNYTEFETQKNNFILNFLFYKKAQSEFKILKLIKDVPPSRLDILREKEIETHDIANKILGESNRWYLNLGRMYYLLPVRMSRDRRGRKEVVDYKKVLEFYNSLFSAKPISYRFLIEQFVELACVYRFKKVGVYNVTERIKKPEDVKEREWDTKLIYAMIEANLLLLYLKNLNLLKVLKGGDVVEIDKMGLEEEIKEYMREIEYSEQETALFLLGYLIGEVANAQFKKGQTKPILNKITYQGMNAGKIMRLTNEIFEKLKQYDKLSYNEGKFAEMKKLLDKHIENWGLSDQENVFYVLSGYAYNTYKALIRGKQEENKKGGDEK